MRGKRCRALGIGDTVKQANCRLRPQVSAHSQSPVRSDRVLSSADLEARLRDDLRILGTSNAVACRLEMLGRIHRIVVMHACICHCVYDIATIVCLIMCYMHTRVCLYIAYVIHPHIHNTSVIYTRRACDNTISYCTTPCHATLMPHYAVPCHSMPCHTMPHHAVLYHAIPCHIPTRRNATPKPAIWL